jgi:hypothetical protein
MKVVVEKCFIENLQFILRDMIEAGVAINDIKHEGDRC